MGTNSFSPVKHLSTRNIHVFQECPTAGTEEPQVWGQDPCKIPNYVGMFTRPPRRDSPALPGWYTSSLGVTFTHHQAPCPCFCSAPWTLGLCKPRSRSVSLLGVPRECAGDVYYQSLPHWWLFSQLKNLRKAASETWVVWGGRGDWAPRQWCRCLGHPASGSTECVQSREWNCRMRESLIHPITCWNR